MCWAVNELEFVKEAPATSHMWTGTLKVKVNPYTLMYCFKTAFTEFVMEVSAYTRFILSCQYYVTFSCYDRQNLLVLRPKLILLSGDGAFLIALYS